MEGKGGGEGGRGDREGGGWDEVEWEGEGERLERRGEVDVSLGLYKYDVLEGLC